METENSANKKESRLVLLIHLAISLAITYFILRLIEQSWPNSVAPFLNYRWLIWAAGSLILATMIGASLGRPSNK